MKARAKKQAKLQQVEAEKAEIAKRKEEKTAPIIKAVKRIAIAVFVTILILYVGVLINNQLPDILVRLTEKGV